MNWNDVNVSEYIEIKELSVDELTPTELMLESIYIVSGENYNNVDDDELTDILSQYEWLLTSPIPVKNKVSFKRISYGTWIDLNKFSYPKSPYLNVEKISALMTGYELFEDKCKEILEEPITYHIGIVDQWLEYRHKLINNYSDLFEDSDDEEEDEPLEKDEVVLQRWANERIVYDLAKGDITKAQDVLKLPHLLVFNWLTMVKDLKLNRKSQSDSENY